MATSSSIPADAFQRVLVQQLLDRYLPSGRDAARDGGADAVVVPLGEARARRAARLRTPRPAPAG